MIDSAKSYNSVCIFFDHIKFSDSVQGMAGPPGIPGPQGSSGLKVRLDNSLSRGPFVCKEE